MPETLEERLARRARERAQPPDAGADTTIEDRLAARAREREAGSASSGDIVLPEGQGNPDVAKPPRSKLALAKIAKAEGAVTDAADQTDSAFDTYLKSSAVGGMNVAKRVLRGVATIDDNLGNAVGAEPSKLARISDQAAAAIGRKEIQMAPSEESVGAHPLASAGGESLGEFSAASLPYMGAGVAARPFSRMIGRMAEGTALGADAAGNATVEGLKTAARALPGHAAVNIAPTVLMDPEHNPVDAQTIGFSLLGALTEGHAPHAAPARGDGGARLFDRARKAVAGAIHPETVKELATTKEQRDVAQRVAETDALTGAGNDRAYKRALATAEADPSTSIVRFDLNGFKSVNDTHGHAAGDAVLQGVPKIMSDVATEAGIPDRTFRVGGDEFAAIVPKDVAGTYRDLVEQKYGIQDHGADVRTSISGGVGETNAAADAQAITRKQIHKAEQGIKGRDDAGGVKIAPTTAAAEEAGIIPSARVVSMKVADLSRDPARFQYKQDVNDKGVTRHLGSVEKFNPDLAGAIGVWKDPVDSKTYVVNGHHRYELAERTGADRMDVHFIDAKTADEAKAHGALANIAEGQGTALDAAHFLKGTTYTPEDLKAHGVDLHGRIAKAGFSLSKLEPDIFSKVATGKISEAHGAIIGSSLEDPAMQRAAAGLVENSPKQLTEAQVRELVAQVRSAGSEQVTQDNLFGTDNQDVSLVYHRADIAAEIKKRLAGDKKLFGYVAKGNRAEELARGGNQINVSSSAEIAKTSAILEEAFNREAHAAGDVGRAITEAARRIANGEKLKSVVDDIYEPIRSSVEASLPGGEGSRGEVHPGAGQNGQPSAAEGIQEAGVGASSEVDPAQDALFAPADNNAPERIRSAAIRINGKDVVEGRMHGEAYDNAHQQGLLGSSDPHAKNQIGPGALVPAEAIEDGFTTTAIDPATGKHRFVDRETAHEIADRHNQLNERAREAGYPDLGAEDLRYEGPFNKNGMGIADWKEGDPVPPGYFFPDEKVGKPAILIKETGDIVEGFTHPDAAIRAVDSGKLPKDFWNHASAIEKTADGFTTSRRPFVSREDAYAIADRAKQLREGAHAWEYGKGEGSDTPKLDTLDLNDADFHVPPTISGKPLPKMKLMHEIRGYHSGGQTDGYVVAMSDPLLGKRKEIGRLDYSHWHGELFPNMVRVRPEFRRQGVATALYDRLREEWPDAELANGYATPDGVAFRAAYDKKHGLDNPLTADQELELDRVAQNNAAADESLSRPETDLFGEPTRSEPLQSGLFSDRAGTEASRNLSQTESAARSALEKLRESHRLETDPAKKAKTAATIAQLDKLVNRSEKITAEEMSTRAAAETVDNEPPVDQESLFAVAGPPATVRRAAKILGPKAPPPADVKALFSISRNMAKALTAPLHAGRARLAQRRALGVFFTKSESIRVRDIADVSTVAHEIGHYVSKKHLGNPTRKGGKGAAVPKYTLPSTAVTELNQMGADLYGSRKPAGGYGEEGIAQYFSFYVTEPARMLAEAPTFHAFMEANVYPKEPALKAILDQSAVDYAAYQAAPPEARIDAQISVDEKVRNMPTVRGMIHAMIDKQHEIKLAVDELGGERDPRKNAGVLAQLTHGDAGASEEMIQRGIADFATKARVTRGVEEILKEIPRARRQALRRYLVAEGTLELAGRGIKTGVSLEDAQHVADDLRPEFEKHAEELWGIRQALIDYRVEAGLLTEKEGELIKEKNQRRLGFFRVFDEHEANSRGGAGSGYGRNSSGLQKIKGSSRRIVDPLESLLGDIYNTVHQSHTHQVMQQLVAHAQRTDGGAKVVEVLTEAPQHSVQIPIERVIDQLLDLGFEIPKDMPKDQIEKLAAGVLESFQKNVTAGPRETKDMVIPMVKNGERFWVQIKDRRLFDSLKGLDRVQLPMWARIVGYPTRLLRAGSTLGLEFSGLNIARDAWQSSIFSEGGWHLPGYNLSRGLFSLLGKDQYYQRWRLEGGDNAAMQGLDRATRQRSLKNFLRSPGEVLRDVVIHPIDTMRILSSISDNATRLGEMKTVLEKELAGGAPKAAAAKTATLASRNTSLDFLKSGVVGQHLNNIIEFFNPAVQGIEQITREFARRPGTVTLRAVSSITIPSIAIYMLQRDDPVYKEIPRWQKDLMWIWVQRGEDGKVKHIWRVPKPRELGIVFGSVPERILEWVDGHDPHTLDSIAQTLLQVAAPSYIPTILKPIIENWSNKSLFTDRPIVPRSVQRFDPAHQASRYSSETARLLGETFGYSPAKIDNWIRGYTGRIGSQYATPVVDNVIKRARRLMGKEPLAPESDPRGVLDVPGLRAFAVKQPGYDAESVEQVYQRFDSAEQKRQTWKMLLNEGHGAEAKQYFQENKAEIMTVVTKEDGGSSGILREAYTTIGKLQDVAHSIENAKHLSAADREEKLRRVYDAMIKVAQSANPHRQRPAPAPDPVDVELEQLGVQVPKELASVARSAVNSPEYKAIDGIAAELVANNPKYSSRNKGSLARELKKTHIENAIAAFRRSAK